MSFGEEAGGRDSDTLCCRWIVDPVLDCGYIYVF